MRAIPFPMIVSLIAVLFAMACQASSADRGVADEGGAPGDTGGTGGADPGRAGSPSAGGTESGGHGPSGGTAGGAVGQAGAAAQGGAPTGTVARADSEWAVTPHPYNQDLTYYITSSLRQAGSADPLPFDMPARATLAASTHKAYAHYFPQFPVSIDNEDPDSDYYARGWLLADGEGGIHAAYGGYLRDRPLPRAPRSGDWALADATDEARWARDAGLDGFLVDTLGWSGSNYDRGVNAFRGAAALGDPTFGVAYMIDTDVVSGSDAETAAARLKAAWDLGSYATANDMLIVAGYRPEGNSTLSFWQNIDSLLRTTHGLSGLYFVPCYSSNWGARSTFNALAAVDGIWTIGNTPGADSSSWLTQAHADGKLFMQPIAPGDSRPRAGVFDEQEGLRTLRDQWLTAIANDVDWVQYRTWSDFSEGAQMMPTRANGYAYLDVSAYYLSRWKTGTYPEIKRDAIYLGHRISTWDNQDTQVAQTQWMSPRDPAGHPGQNIVDVLTFLVAPATVTVWVGTNTYTYEAPAGVFEQTFPLAVGQVSASASR